MNSKKKTTSQTYRQTIIIPNAQLDIVNVIPADNDG